MMRLLLIVLGLAAMPALAQPAPAKKLAQETLELLNQQESFLAGSIRSGELADFKRFTAQPVEKLLARWPADIAAPHYIDYARCRFAAGDFLVYARDEFDAQGQRPKGAPSAKQYLDNKAKCKQSLKR